VIGVLGIVLFDQTSAHMRALTAQFARLQQQLQDAQRELDAQRSQGALARRTKYTLASFVGASPAAVEVKRQARRAAQSGSPVLLLGETGTGKELLAHGIHAASARARGRSSASTSPPCPRRCWRPSSSAWRRAPTPAPSARARGQVQAGRRRHAVSRRDRRHAALQAKLLRALQDGEIEPLGSNRLLRSTRASSPPPAATCRRWWPGSSAKTCTTA
jgi:hypothetical protein